MFVLKKLKTKKQTIPLSSFSWRGVRGEVETRVKVRSNCEELACQYFRSIFYPMPNESLVSKERCVFAKKLRKNMTPEEIILWKILRGRRSRNLKFRRQVNVGPFFVDFLCKEYKLIIEVDGGIHLSIDQKEHDFGRDAYLKDLGFNVLRIKNSEITYSLPEVIEKIHKYIKQIRSHT